MLNTDIAKDRVRIFDYHDYRQYLADYFTRKKASNPNFSHRVFARQTGLSSPSHLLMLIKGERNLSIKTLHKISEGMKLTNKEKRYFELMVQYNQTDDLQMKAKYFTEILALKALTQGLHRLEKEKFDFLSKWQVVALYVLIDLKEFRADLEWIAKKLGGKISTAEIKNSIDSLLKLGMIELDSQKGYRQISGAITVADDTKSIAVFKYHQSMIRLAAEALRTSTPDLREMNGATVAIPKEKLPEFKEKIRAFRKEINQLASSFNNADEVYQLNIQFFPLTVTEEK